MPMNLKLVQPGTPLLFSTNFFHSNSSSSYVSPPFSRFLRTKSLRIDARDRIPNSKTLLDKILHVRRTRKTRKNSNNRQDVINSNKNSWLTGDSTRLDSFDRPSPSIVPVIGRKDGSFFSSLPLFLPSFLPSFLFFARFQARAVYKYKNSAGFSRCRCVLGSGLGLARARPGERGGSEMRGRRTRPIPM